MENRKFKLSWEDIGSLDPISSTKTALHILFRANIYDCLFKRNNKGLDLPAGIVVLSLNYYGTMSQ